MVNVENRRHPAQARPQAGSTVTGHVVRLMEGYSREIRVGQPILVAVLTAAGVARLVGTVITSILRAGSGAGGGRRSFKDLRKGPEFLVTPLRLRTADGRVRELEIHGHLPQSALHPADHVHPSSARLRRWTSALLSYGITSRSATSPMGWR